MYESFFGFTHRPFSTAPDGQDYLPTESGEAAWKAVTNCVRQHAGPAVIIADTGIGKTTLSLSIRDHFQGAFQVAVVHGAACRNRGDLLRNTLHAFGRSAESDDECQLRIQLTEFVTNHVLTVGGALLLLLDEADSFDFDLLGEVKTLADIVQKGRRCLNVVLLGTQRLEMSLAANEMAALNQRIAARAFLYPWTKGDVESFLGRRIADAGGRLTDVMTQEAVNAVHEISSGIPRIVVQVTDHAFLTSFLAEQPVIDAQEIHLAWSDLQQIPLMNQSFQPTAAPTEPVVEFGSLDDDGHADSSPSAMMEFGLLDDEPPIGEYEEDSGDRYEATELLATSDGDESDLPIETSSLEQAGHAENQETPGAEPEDIQAPGDRISPLPNSTDEMIEDMTDEMEPTANQLESERSTDFVDVGPGDQLPTFDQIVAGVSNATPVEAGLTEDAQSLIVGPAAADLPATEGITLSNVYEDESLDPVGLSSVESVDSVKLHPSLIAETSMEPLGADMECADVDCVETESIAEQEAVVPTDEATAESVGEDRPELCHEVADEVDDFTRVQERLDSVERDIVQIEREFTGAALDIAQPSTGLSENPFLEQFNEEELIIDRPLAINVSPATQPHTVATEEGRALQDILELIESRPRPPVSDPILPRSGGFGVIAEDSDLVDKTLAADLPGSLGEATADSVRHDLPTSGPMGQSDGPAFQPINPVADLDLTPPQSTARSVPIMPPADTSTGASSSLDNLFTKLASD